MARVRDVATLAKKFAQRAGAASSEYAEGVKASGQDWQQAAMGAGDNWQAGIQQAAAQDQYRKGVSRSGGAYYAEKAGTVGAQRYAPGVQAAGPVWAEGAAPYLEAGRQPLSTPRRPKGQNAARAQEMSERMRAIKVSR